MNRTKDPLSWWCDAMCVWVRLAQANTDAALHFWRAAGLLPPRPLDSDVAAVFEAARHPAPAPGAKVRRGRPAPTTAATAA